MRTFVLGDIHGAYRALRQCLDRAEFDYEHDHLIALGDVCDGWPETKACITELLKIHHVTYIMGNHDLMMQKWILDGIADEHWLMQGGQATVDSYPKGVPQNHVKFIRNALSYFQSENRVFVHAGFNPSILLEDQKQDTFCWDRTLARTTLDAYVRKESKPITTFDEVYIGHTPIPYNEPICAGGVWMMDTGAGWSGPLSLMDIKTKEVILSDKVTELYPGVKGRAQRH